MNSAMLRGGECGCVQEQRDQEEKGVVCRKDGVGTYQSKL